jgi:hypothetical protein
MIIRSGVAGRNYAERSSFSRGEKRDFRDFGWRRTEKHVIMLLPGLPGVVQKGNRIMTDSKSLTEGFAFVDATKVPKRQSDDRLAAFREEQKAARAEAGAQVAKGLLTGKALTDNVVYKATSEQLEDGSTETILGRNHAVRVASRAKALADPALAESGMRASVTVTGSEEEGFRWFVVAKAIPTE